MRIRTGKRSPVYSPCRPLYGQKLCQVLAELRAWERAGIIELIKGAGRQSRVTLNDFENLFLLYFPPFFKQPLSGERGIIICLAVQLAKSLNMHSSFFSICLLPFLYVMNQSSSSIISFGSNQQ